MGIGGAAPGLPVPSVDVTTVMYSSASNLSRLLFAHGSVGRTRRSENARLFLVREVYVYAAMVAPSGPRRAPARGFSCDLRLTVRIERVIERRSEAKRLIVIMGHHL